APEQRGDLRRVGRGSGATEAHRCQRLSAVVGLGRSAPSTHPTQIAQGPDRAITAQSVFRSRRPGIYSRAGFWRSAGFGSVAEGEVGAAEAEVRTVKRVAGPQEVRPPAHE